MTGAERYKHYVRFCATASLLCQMVAIGCAVWATLAWPSPLEVAVASAICCYASVKVHRFSNVEGAAHSQMAEIVGHEFGSAFTERFKGK